MMYKRLRGFTLVEMIVVLVITGIIGGVVATFLRTPVQGYVDSARRAELSDIADTSLRRFSRDLRLALPNSVRVTGGCAAGAACYIEFLPTSGGGRYRSASGVGHTDFLDFTQPDSSFEVVGTPPVILGGVDSVVVYNMTSDPADPNPNAYVGGVNGNRALASIAGNIVSLAPAKRFPMDACQSDPVTNHIFGCRFQVINTPVTYAYNPAAGTLSRWQGYPIQAAQPIALPGGTATVLATNVTGCIFTYNANVVAQRYGLVTMHLTISERNLSNGTLESVTLYGATHVSNVP